MNLLSANLKRLRLAKNLTQEQAAVHLGVSPQSVSRWECGTTLPDVTILPQIARLYCVTIDDLYREHAVAYDNYAQRLGSIYEASLEPEDFLRADQEYRKLLRSNSFTTEDLRSYGILHHHMMDYCIKRSEELFDRVLNKGPEEDPETYWRTKRQKIYLYYQIGRIRECVDEARAAVAANSRNLDHWLCLILALSFAGEGEECYELYLQAEALFPDSALLYCFGGDIQEAFGRYEEAFQCWDKALALDETVTDAMYSKGFCYEKLGQWENAYHQWTELADTLTRRGYDAEVQYPRSLAKKCKERM